jgi:uncharacterized protein (DUF488 family)
VFGLEASTLESSANHLAFFQISIYQDVIIESVYWKCGEITQKCCHKIMAQKLSRKKCREIHIIFRSAIHSAGHSACHSAMPFRLLHSPLILLLKHTFSVLNRCSRVGPIWCKSTLRAQITPLKIFLHCFGVNSLQLCGHRFGVNLHYERKVTPLKTFLHCLWCK